ncbi:MAG: NADH-quinone oxidoreductase subunit C [Thermodesulfovibrionales bacterium]
MEPLQIAERLRERFPEDVREIKEFRDQVSVIVKRDHILDLLRFLKEEPDIQMDFLKDLTAVDWLGKKIPRFEVVYHLYSIKFRHILRLKAEVPEEDPVIDSVMPIYIGANWHERECYDMFGIQFRGHPDLRRILLPEDWEGYPLRKDYPLEGYKGDKDWSGFREVLQIAERNKRFDWYGGTQG